MIRPDTSKPRILIADDDAEIKSVLHEFLSRWYTCVEVGSAEEALSLLRVEKFHLIVSDIVMDGMSGLEMVPHVLRLAPDTAIVMLSGSQTIEDAIEAMRVGAFDYITKPFDLFHVEVIIRRALEHQDLLQSKRQYEKHLEELIKQRTSELNTALDSLGGAYRSTLKALVAALEMRDKDTHGHSERVVSFSLRLGRELGLDAGRMRDLEFGSMLHDIGKIGIPDAILRKPAGLNDEEWEKMRQHPELGQQILGGIEFLEGASRVVAQHHERWDGSGYPLRLSGEEIDICARIFTVADAFDAIVSDRVYSPSKSYDLAAAELDRCAGEQFDPAVVAAFHRVPREEWEEMRRCSTGKVRSQAVPSPDRNYSQALPRPIPERHMSRKLAGLMRESPAA
jgi:response regulator RpfG family c-di-GMP phosphodiesterase